MQNEASRKVLLVSQQAPWAPPWADLVIGGQKAIDQWRKHKYLYVFADFGNLGDGMTGSRFCSTLRKEPGTDGVDIVLMSDLIQPHHLAWAQQTRANGVIVRSLDAIIGRVAPEAVNTPVQLAVQHASQAPGAQPVQQPAAQAAAPQAPQPAASNSVDKGSLIKVVSLVESRLHVHGRMGPARSIVVADAVEDFAREFPGSLPTATDLAQRVANDIRSPADRAEFLKSFVGGE
jgi:CheY-like chemotaxis protein